LSSDYSVDYDGLYFLSRSIMPQSSWRNGIALLLGWFIRHN